MRKFEVLELERMASDFLMERKWVIAAVILLLAAAIFLWRSQLEAAFVAATLGLISWFLDYRNQLKRNIISTPSESESEKSESIEMEDADES